MPEIPVWFNEQVERLRGKSLYGDPVIRVVWGADQRDWRGNYKYVHPNGGPMNCFVLERWQPAGFFGSRENWEKGFYDERSQKWTNTRGPFPTRGAYTMLAPIWTEDGKFEPLTEDTLIAIREKLAKDEEFASLPVEARKYMVEEDHKREEERRFADADMRQEYIREYHLKNWDKINRTGTTGYSITPR